MQRVLLEAGRQNALAQSEWRDFSVVAVAGKDLAPEQRKIMSGAVEGGVEKGGYSGEDVSRLVRRLVDERVGRPDGRP
jgi:hypothetical protein